MKFPWIIRGFFVSLLLLSISAWTYSYIGAACVEYHSPSQAGSPAVAEEAALDLAQISYGTNLSYGTVWIYRLAEPWRDEWQAGGCFDQERPAPRGAGPLGKVPSSILGFSHGQEVGDDAGAAGALYWFIGIPLWFPIALSTIALVWVWRRGRYRRSVEIGSPVAASQRRAAFRCWVLRGLAIGSLSLCLAAWAGSYLRDASVSCMGYDLWTLDIGAGEVGLEYWPDYREIYGWRAGEPMWHGALTPPPANGILEALSDASDYTTATHFLGFFHLGNNPYQPGLQAGGIPFWFLAALSALAAVLVWRKTGKTRMHPAFPVQLHRQNAAPNK